MPSPKCLYCAGDVIIEEAPGWGVTEDGKFLHDECAEQFDDVHLYEGEL